MVRPQADALIPGSESFGKKKIKTPQSLNELQVAH